MFVLSKEPKFIGGNQDYHDKLRSNLNYDWIRTNCPNTPFSKIRISQYDAKLKYEEEILKEPMNEGYLSINIGTQFQIDADIKKVKSKIVFESSDVGLSATFEEEIYKTTGLGFVIKSNNGVEIAEFFPKVGHLNLLFSTSNLSSDKLFRIIYFVTRIVIKFYDNLLLEENSFSKITDEEKRIEMVTKEVSKKFEEKRKRISLDIRDTESAIKSYTQSLIQEYKNLEINQKLLDGISGDDREESKSIIKELLSIMEIPYIRMVTIKDGYFIFSTHYLPIYDNETIWEGNEYLVKINLNDGHVRISSLNGVGFKGHWSQSDPHPHVDGRNGYPCLGSIGGVVPKLIGKLEFNPLTIIMLEYLKSVNRDDSAGSKITSSGRKKLTKKEHDELMAYEISQEVEAVEEIKTEKSTAKKKPTSRKKKAPDLVEVLESIPAVVEQQEQTEIVIGSTCCVCGVDVYSHGVFDVVMDASHGEETIGVVCRTCVTPGNFTTRSGMLTYLGTEVITPIEDAHLGTVPYVDYEEDEEEHDNEAPFEPDWNDEE